ncbi:Fucose permease [Arcticibacter svalbardensis MN12-7]|uniref:Fucose permease n=1 Tax=Arcticibacter svalbardensis MN12-7 TaxID=1150600 RepID=R9GYU6_9SPHI|nr:Fucose permease [Arcticibacter svalbardensis MN12-7]
MGAILGVIVGTLFIFSGVEHSQQSIETMKASGLYDAYLQSETMRVVIPYIVIGCIVLIWAFVLYKTKFPETKKEENTSYSSKGSFKKLFSHRHFRNGVITQFCYVGAQVGTWSYYIPYVQDYTGGSEKLAGYLLTGTLAAFGIGRFMATIVMKYYAPEKLMGAFSIINILLVSISVLFPGWLGLWSIFLTSFFMSLMFPTIFTLSIKGLGDNTKLGGSIIVMAIIGGAVFTPLMGIIADSTHSMAIAMLVPLACYLVVTWFSYSGSASTSDLKISDDPEVFTSH